MSIEQNNSIREKLRTIQETLKAPKNLYNSFGDYKYRNLEGICEEVKPYLKEQGCMLILSDEVEEVGGRVYVKATAKICDTATGEEISTTAYAREALEKKKMDEAQITGAASSYARKYALNGLLLLDDTKDADTDEYTKQTKNEDAPISKKNLDVLRKKCEVNGVDEKVICKDFNIESLDSLTASQFISIANSWSERYAKDEK